MAVAKTPTMPKALPFRGLSGTAFGSYGFQVQMYSRWLSVAIEMVLDSALKLLLTRSMSRNRDIATTYPAIGLYITIKIHLPL